MKAALRAFLTLCLPFLQGLTIYSQSLPAFLRFNHFDARYNPDLFGNAMHVNHAFDGVTHPDFNTTLQYTLSGNLTIEFWMRVPPYMLTERQSATVFEQKDGAVRLYLVNPCVLPSSTPPCDFTRHSLFFQIETFNGNDNNAVIYGIDAEIPGYNEWFHVAIVVNHSKDVYLPDDFYHYDLDGYPGGADQAANDYYDHQVLPQEMGIYINGVKQMRRDPTDSYYYKMMAPDPESIKKSTGSFAIGPGGTNGIWIDDFRIWKETAKLQSGIRSTMNAPLPAGQDGFAFQNGLYAYFKYDASPGSPSIYGTIPGAGLDRTVPNMSRGAGSPTSDGNYALMGSMTFDTYGAYPAFGKGRTFRLVRSGNLGYHSIIYENWDGTFPGASYELTIELEHENDIVDLNNHVFFRSILFKKGKLRTNGYELMVNYSTLGASPASYVITSKGAQAETGPYVKSLWYRKETLTTLPIGSEAHYLPVAIAANSSGDFTPVASVKETLPAGLAEQSMALQVPWDIKVRNANPGMTYKVKLQWNEENEGGDFDRSHIYFANFHNGAWRKLGQGLPATEEEPGVYSATINVDGFSEFTVIGSPAALPVRLAGFSAQPEGRSTALLSWSTTYEENTSHFVIEKSSDAGNWYPVGQVMARNMEKGNHYRFTDRTGARDSQHLYYRLKMVDLDGQFAYSKIESIRLDGGVFTGIYPNPVTGSFFNLADDLTGRINQVKLFSAAGTEVLKAAADTSGKILLPALNPGLYIAEMTGKDGTVYREKVMISRSAGN